MEHKDGSASGEEARRDASSKGRLRVKKASLPPPFCCAEAAEKSECLESVGAAGNGRLLQLRLGLTRGG